MDNGREMTMARPQFVVEPGKQETVITHTFDAPRERVFKAMTDPKLFAQWWGPRNMTNKIETMDVKAGGRWRVVQREPDGQEYAFSGVFHAVVPPERLIYTFEFEGMPGHVLMETITLHEQNGKTTVTNQSVFQSVEDRDGMVASGMESGARESMERLAELLAKG